MVHPFAALRLKLVERFRFGSFKSAWKEGSKTFAKATAVYGGAIGFGGIEPYEILLLRALIARFPEESIPALKEGLASDNPTIVGYCILGLKLASRLDLSDAMKRIRIPDRQLEWCYASTGVELTVREFVKLLSSEDK